MAENKRMTGGAKIERVALADLVSDPANLRRRDDRAKAGNGTLEAAIAAGCTEALIVTPEPGQVVAVRRGDWSATEGVAYSVGDNHTAEHATWDDAGLAETLRALQSEDFDLAAVGFTDAEVDALIGEIRSGLLPPEADGKEYDESVADEVEFCECPNCGHKWPK